jgi:rRNA maturation endonuclease Nob1
MMNALQVNAAHDAAFDRDERSRYVCDYCVMEVSPKRSFCAFCGEYDGIILMTEWEDSNGMWED